MPGNRWLFFIIAGLLLQSVAHAGNWTEGMKAFDEFREIVDAMRIWENDNILHSLELNGQSYLVKTEKCEFSVSFVYQESDPEKKIKRTFKSVLRKGKHTDCENFFKK